MPAAEATRIVIASCCRTQDASVEHGVWAEIARDNPDALLLLGDNVYLDNDRIGDPVELTRELAGRYAELAAQPDFRELRAHLRDLGRPLLACYDDHDFLGDDRCGGDVADDLRQAARAAFVAQWAPPRTGDDVYSRQSIGNVDVTVLDTRFYREGSTLQSAATRDAVLGARQWTWFEAELARSRSAYIVVVSSSSFHNFSRRECWEHYPAAFARMRDLLRSRAGALFVSGDIHVNSLYDDSGVVEVVSSGVARRGLVFGGLRRNYGVLTFDENGVDIDLRSNKVWSRFRTRIELAQWRLG